MLTEPAPIKRLGQTTHPIGAPDVDTGVADPYRITDAVVSRGRTDVERLMSLWELAPNLADIPVDELGMRVLAHIAQAAKSGGQPNRWNVLNEAQQRHNVTGAGLVALSASLQWLEAEVLVAPAGTQHERDWIVVTPLGTEALKRGVGYVRAIARIGVDLHPRIERKVRRQFLMGEYELAAFAAMREVEIRIRELDDDCALTGRDLAHHAFNKDGRLRDHSIASGEADSTMSLFSGALGVFRNPVAHREVDYDDPTHAAEVIITASLLLRLLDHVATRVES